MQSYVCVCVENNKIEKKEEPKLSMCICFLFLIYVFNLFIYFRYWLLFYLLPVGTYSI